MDEEISVLRDAYASTLSSITRTRAQIDAIFAKLDSTKKKSAMVVQRSAQAIKLFEGATQNQMKTLEVLGNALEAHKRREEQEKIADDTTH